MEFSEKLSQANGALALSLKAHVLYQGALYATYIQRLSLDHCNPSLWWIAFEKNGETLQTPVVMHARISDISVVAALACGTHADRISKIEKSGCGKIRPASTVFDSRD